MTQLSVWNRIANTPLSKLQQEPTETLVNLLEQAKKDNKEALKAIHWLEGLIKLGGMNNG